MKTETWVLAFSVTGVINASLLTLILFGLPINRHIALLAYLFLWMVIAVLLASLDKLCNYWESRAPGVGGNHDRIEIKGGD